MNGLEAAKELRLKYGHQFKIFLLTGNVMMRNTEEENLDGILTKPCSKTELQACLVGLMKNFTNKADK